MYSKNSEDEKFGICNCGYKNVSALTVTAITQVHVHSSCLCTYKVSHKVLLISRTAQSMSVC